MKYDFNTPVQRRYTNSSKWDKNPEMPDDFLPLWVADMDFKAAPAILKALQDRLNVGVFGYTKVPDTYYRAIIDWFERRHGWRFNREDILYTIGVVPAVSVIIKALTQPGDGVVVMTPIYNCFFSSIRNNGCRVLECDLVSHPEGEHEEYFEIDFDRLEEVCALPEAKVLLLCNPHNPAGRIWTADELRRIDLVAARNGVVVVSDEIHCELTRPGLNYTPFATVATQPCVVTSSPSKAFNIAGLQNAFIVCSDHEILERIDRAININEVCDVNPFGVDAVIAAYNESEDWLDALRVYIWDNYSLLEQTVAKDLPGFRLARLEGTYLAWLDYSEAIPSMDSDELTELLLRRTHVRLNSGMMYGGEGTTGTKHLRINLACPRSILTEALRRIVPILQELSR